MKHDDDHDFPRSPAELADTVVLFVAALGLIFIAVYLALGY